MSGYIKTPRALAEALLTKKVPFATGNVFQVIALKSFNNLCSIGRKDLACLLDLDICTVSRHLNRLEKLGFIKIHWGSGGKHRGYEILFDETSSENINHDSSNTYHDTNDTVRHTSDTKRHTSDTKRHPSSIIKLNNNNIYNTRASDEGFVVYSQLEKLKISQFGTKPQEQFEKITDLWPNKQRINLKKSQKLFFKLVAEHGTLFLDGDDKQHGIVKTIAKYASSEEAKGPYCKGLDKYLNNILETKLWDVVFKPKLQEEEKQAASLSLRETFNLKVRKLFFAHSGNVDRLKNDFRLKMELSVVKNTHSAEIAGAWLAEEIEKLKKIKRGGCKDAA